MINVDWNFVIENEGGVVVDGYVPVDDHGRPLGRSGVTIGAGVDLGQMSPLALDNLPVQDATRDAVRPYVGITGQAAIDILLTQPLSIAADEAQALTEAVFGTIVEAVRDSYDDAVADVPFEDLPSEAQTVIADLAIQYGPRLPVRTPRFWSFVTGQLWIEAEQELRNFGDAYTVRRTREADLLRRAIDRGLLASDAQLPQLLAIWPDSGAGGEDTTLTGRALDTIRSVYFGNTQATFMILSSEALVARVPLAQLSGEVNVTASSDLGITSGALRFRYT